MLIYLNALAIQCAEQLLATRIDRHVWCNKWLCSSERYVHLAVIYQYLNVVRNQKHSAKTGTLRIRLGGDVNPAGVHHSSILFYTP